MKIIFFAQVVNRINPKEGNREAETEPTLIENEKRKRPHMGYRSVDESKMPKNETKPPQNETKPPQNETKPPQNATKRPKKKKDATKKFKYLPKNNESETDLPNYLPQEMLENPAVSENEIDSNDATLADEDSEDDTTLPNEESPNPALPNEESTKPALPNEEPEPDPELPNEDSKNDPGLPHKESENNPELPNEESEPEPVPNKESSNAALPNEASEPEPALTIEEASNATLPNDELEVDATLPDYLPSVNIISTSTNKIPTEAISPFDDDYEIEYEEDSDDTTIVNVDSNMTTNVPPNMSIIRASINTTGNENADKNIPKNIPPEISIVGASINIDGFEIGMERPSVVKTSINVDVSSLTSNSVVISLP